MEDIIIYLCCAPSFPSIMIYVNIHDFLEK